MKKELTVKEYAEQEGIAPSTVYMRIAAGTVEAKKAGATGKGQIMIVID